LRFGELVIGVAGAVRAAVTAGEAIELALGAHIALRNSGARSLPGRSRRPSTGVVRGVARAVV